MIPFSILAAIAFLAYLVKGLTGFGPAIVFISLGSMVVSPARVVAISPILDVLAGSILLWRDRGMSVFHYWSRLTVPLLAGVFAGSLGLRFASSAVYNVILGGAIIILGIWFIVRKNPTLLSEERIIPTRPEKGAVLASLISGITGGLFGISGPPLIWYFGRRYPKSVFRKIIVPIFFVEALGRSIIYTSMGMIGKPEWLLIACLVPAVPIGLLIGNRWFNRIPQERFEKIIGWILIASGIKMSAG